MRYFEFSTVDSAERFLAENYGALRVEGYPTMLKSAMPSVIKNLKRFATEVNAPY